MKALAQTKAIIDRIPENTRARFIDLLPIHQLVPPHGVGNKRRFRALLHSRPLTSATALEALIEARRAWSEPLGSRTSMLAWPSDATRTAFANKEELARKRLRQRLGVTSMDDSREMDDAGTGLPLA